MAPIQSVFGVHAYVCMCVCERESERAMEGRKEGEGRGGDAEERNEE